MATPDPGSAPMVMTSETRLSTGVKMFLILTLALLPLGLIALFASLQASRTADLEKAALLNVAANESARNLVAEIVANGAALRVVVNALAANRKNTSICARADEILRKRGDARVDFIIHDRQSDAPLCASDPNLVLTLPGNNPFGADPADILPKQKRLIVRTLSGDGQLVAIAIYKVSHLERITSPATALQNHQIALVKGSALLVVGSTLRPRASGHFNRVRTPVGNAGIDLLLTVRDPPINIARSLSVFLPLLMWIAAAGIGWFVVNRLLIFPLIQLRRLVSDYQPGEVLEPLRKMPTPAQEIRDLGNTFRAITQTVADHEGELAASLDRQTRLTREVHHRVKNNLQIIASLINLHSRAAPTQEAADAYASIQRRVDALSVVHRNHYAELEEHRGVGIRSLVSELSVALGSSMPDDAPNMAIQVSSDHLFVSQDVAVPIAFLITELAELALLVDSRAAIRISVRVGESVRQGDNTPRAILRMQSSALEPSEQMTQYLDQRFGRILTGLSRQLRAQLDYAPDKGEYAIAISLCE